MLDLTNRTWFIIPINIPIILFLLWGYSELQAGRTSPIVLILDVLMVICFGIYIYYKLEESTKQAFKREYS